MPNVRNIYAILTNQISDIENEIADRENELATGSGNKKLSSLLPKYLHYANSDF